MAEVRPIRHQIDFQLIPALYHKDPKAFAVTFALAAGELLANIYTDVYKEIKPKHFWQKSRQFSKEDFKVRKELYPDGVHIIYVTLPPVDDGSHVYCTAYALVIGDNEAKFYTVEKSVFGTTCIGTVDENGHHINLGDAGSSTEENMEILHGFEMVEEDSTVEVQKTVNPDGSYVEVITDHRNNRAEIKEYDAHGNWVRSTHGTFSDEPKISDDEVDDFIDYLEENEDFDEEEFQRWKANRHNGKVKEKTAEEWLEEGKLHYRNKEFESALECYSNAADLNNADAQNRAGMMIYNGQGTQQNNERAFVFIKKSAENGNVSAMGNLAIMYDRGRGTTKDYVLARKWYKAALENGSDNYSVINNLGFLYLHGLGTDVDYDKAQMYFERAIRKGCEAAKNNLTELKKRRGVESSNNDGGNSNPSSEEQHKEIRWKPKNIMDEVRMMVMSCSSPPIVGTPEENARRVMEKIEYFREKGVSEKDLYELESKILLFMPDFVVKNFEEFYSFLKEDISSIYITMELLMAKGDYVAAKKIADPLAAYLESHKTKLIDGHHCHQNSFETALYTLEARRTIPTQSTKDNYTAFLVAYARILQNTKIVRHNQEMFRMAESRKYLKWAQEMSPQNASVWLYLGVSYNDNEELQLEYYKKALQYCYLKDGDYGLTKIYECLAMHYWGKNKIEVVTALKELITALDGNPFMLTFLLSKRNVPASRPFQDVLRKYSIQVGFSDLVLQTVDFLEDPRAGVQNNQEVQALMQEIRTVKL